MKRSVVLFLVLVGFYPTVVKANIVCNDGTTSPSCSTCHKGCCSKHGGCSSSSSSSSSSSRGFSSSSSSSSSANTKPVVPEVVKSSDTSLTKVTIDEENIPVMDNMTYTTTKESVMILAVANDSKATVNYTKNPNLIIGENGIDIKVTAENGNVKNYKLVITREKILSDNKNIKIFVAGKEVTFHLFKSDAIHIPYDEEKIDITYELEDLNAHVEIIGNENLQVGHNEVIVRVTAENGETQDYMLVVEKEELKKEEVKEEKDGVQEENIVQKEDKVQNESQTDNDATFISSILLGTGFLGGTSYLIYKSRKKN